VEFIRNETVKLINELEPQHCAMLLESFRRWGVFDRQLVDLIVERLLDEIDRFNTRDVMEVLGVVSRLGLARGYLLRRLCNISFENLRQFTPREIVKISYSLAKLRFLGQSDVDDIVDALSPDLPELRNLEISELLFVLALTDARHHLDTARSLVVQYTAPHRAGGKNLTSLTDFAWSICSLGIAEEFPEDLKHALDDVFGRPPPQNRTPLVKLFDLICSLELEPCSAGITVPPAWRAACDDADRHEMDRLESSRLHNEVVMRFDSLRGGPKGAHWQLRMQRNRPCAPSAYRVDMIDEETKVVLDVEIVSWPTSRRMKHRHLKRLGYKPVLLQYWDWRRARSEEDQSTFLEREVSLALGSAQLE